MTENEYGIEKGTRAMTRDKDELIGQEITLISAEKKDTTSQEGEKRAVNLYTAKLHSNNRDETVQFFGTSVMDNQLAKQSIRLGDRISIDKIVSKESGRIYYAFVLLSRVEKDAGTIRGDQERGDE